MPNFALKRVSQMNYSGNTPDCQGIVIINPGSFSSPIKVNPKSQHTPVEARSDSRLS